jgi:fructosamine-3-kinase
VTLPSIVRDEIESALAVEDGVRRVAGVRAVGGGCVSPAARLELTDGTPCFVKWADGAVPDRFFEAEAESLRALAQTERVRVPRVIAQRERWLLLEWLEPGRPRAQTWRALGRALALLHRTRAPSFGWHADNYIGTLPQSNAWCAAWPEFWRDRRLAPQLETARRAGLLDAGDERAFDALFARLDEWLGAAARDDGASLLHGDLWGGNVHVLADGGAALIDPSSYHGHREVDLAMAELFGGFGRDFFAAYREAWPLAAGYDEVRRATYQLYYLLVHVNLFGGGYVGQTRAVVGRLAPKR